MIERAFRWIGGAEASAELDQRLAGGREQAVRGKLSILLNELHWSRSVERARHATLARMLSWGLAG